MSLHSFPSLASAVAQRVLHEARNVVRLCRDRRGSVLLEQMTVFPLFAALFMLSVFAVRFHAAAFSEQRSLRSCAWHYAASGCKSVPSGCPSPARRQMPDADIRAAAQGGFETIAADLPFLATTLSSLHGDAFAMNRSQSVRRPTSLGGAVEVHATYDTMCNTTTGPWQTAEVFKLTCEKLGIWCP